MRRLKDMTEQQQASSDDHPNMIRPPKSMYHKRPWQLLMWYSSYDLNFYKLLVREGVKKTQLFNGHVP